MNDLKWIEANIDEAKRRLQKRGDASVIDDLMSLFKERRELIIASEELKRRRNETNELLKCADKLEIEKRREEMRLLSTQIKDSDKLLTELEDKFSALSLSMPNLPQTGVPEGANADHNVVVKEIGTKPTFNFAVRDHVELGQLTDTVDFARAAKISGSRFAFLKGAAAKLNRALIQLFCDFHVEHGDLEVAPPYLVRSAAMVGVGQFPKFVDDVFRVEKTGDEPFYLIPTAEAPVTNFFADEIVNEADLPARFCAYSPCFRSEEGAAG